MDFLVLRSWTTTTIKVIFDAEGVHVPFPILTIIQSNKTTQYMNISITKQFTFEASHTLPNHSGKCARLHGHSYLLEVSVSGTPKPDNGESSEGMIMDFKDIKDVVKKSVLEDFDHAHLNDILASTPTAENIALEIFTRLTIARLPVSKVKLWETRSSFVEVAA